MGVVIESSVFIATERRRFDWTSFQAQLGSEKTYISVVTIAELVHGIERADTPDRREGRRRFLSDIEQMYPALAFDREEARVYGKVVATLRTRGELVGLHDMMIAATALHHGLRVATLNPSDFRRVPGLEVFDAERFRIESRQR